jgi:aryl-alcohol dehydrogenase-like predicted oxidoreductase
MENNEFLYRRIPVIDTKVLRLGLACNYGIDAEGIEWALNDGGMQYVFWTPRKKVATEPLRRALKRDRERYVVATGPTTALWAGNLRRFVDNARRTLDTDHIDVLQMFWLGKTSRWNPRIVAELEALRAEGAVRAIGISIHDRRRAAELARTSSLDLLMIRYNAAHPGAEQDIFPRRRGEEPTILAYTATSWRKLLKRPKGWEGKAMTAGDCYRFQLSSPHVDLCLTGPKSRAEVEQNLDALEKFGPLSEDESQWMRAFGRAVHG